MLGAMNLTILSMNNNRTNHFAFEKAQLYMKSGKEPNAKVIRDLLTISITEKQLRILQLSEIYFIDNLHSPKKVINKLRKLGKITGTNSGVYIWTHKASGSKYVGSAIHFPTRLGFYFRNISISKNT